MTRTTYNDIASAIYSSVKNTKGSELDAMITRSIELIVKKRLLSRSNSILSKIQDLIDKDTRTIRVKISSPRAIEKTLKQQLITTLKKRYKAQEVIVEEIQKEDLIGGIKIEIGDEVIDATLQNKVKKLQEYLIKN